MSLQAISFDRIKGNAKVKVLDQLLLPYQTQYLTINTIDDGYRVIKNMQVRGAPAIAIVGALSILLECQLLLNEGFVKTQWYYDVEKFGSRLNERLDFLLSSRPTAVNLSNAITDIRGLIVENLKDTYEALFEYACKVIDEDFANNYRMGENGADHLLKELQEDFFSDDFALLTICNTGSLATSGYGTALGVIRSLYNRTKEFEGKDPEAKKQKTETVPQPKMAHVFPLETRPYNQGSRLTAYELMYEKIPATLITDSSISYLISTSKIPIKAAFVGADRIVRNGDTANKIGTYQLSIICKRFGIKFYVVAPTTTFDTKSETGNEIVVEERPSNEFRLVQGTLVDSETEKVVLDDKGAPVKAKVGITPPEMPVWNPSFDVTPFENIDGIVTERGVFTKGEDKKFHLEELF